MANTEKKVDRLEFAKRLGLPIPEYERYCRIKLPARSYFSESEYQQARDIWHTEVKERANALHEHREPRKIEHKFVEDLTMVALPKDCAPILSLPDARERMNSHTYNLRYEGIRWLVYKERESYEKAMEDLKRYRRAVVSGWRVSGIGGVSKAQTMGVKQTGRGAERVETIVDVERCYMRKGIRYVVLLPAGTLFRRNARHKMLSRPRKNKVAKNPDNTEQTE